MVRITEELVRKKCEHNEGEISSLEELSLHQENIEKIEHLQNWCRNLKILLFHSNIISKIENLNKLKKLEYLNLSLNNIERIENLEGCEMLEKLDLTLNFIGELSSAKSLVHNMHLKTLYLTGNPCTDIFGYREYLIATLPQLESLDGIDIERSERIRAFQNYKNLEEKVLNEQEEYAGRRSIQKIQNEHKYSQMKSECFEDHEKATKFWKEPSDNSPETRIFIAEQSRRQEQKNNFEEKKPKRVYKLFNANDHPVNVNEARIPFSFKESEDLNSYILDISVYKYLDTNYLDVDVQPTYVRVKIKGKILQLVLPEEVKTDSSTAQRSKTTGHLVITMPKTIGKLSQSHRNSHRSYVQPVELVCCSSKREQLEIGPPEPERDISNLIENYAENSPMCHNTLNLPLNTGFIDDPHVPPLE